MGNIQIPDRGDYRIARARVPISMMEARGIEGDNDSLALVDIAVADGRIENIAASAPSQTSGEIDLAGRMILPAFVDCHTDEYLPHRRATRESAALG